MVLAGTFGGSLRVRAQDVYTNLYSSEAQVALVEQMILYVSDKSIPKERGATLVVAYFIVYGICVPPLMIFALGLMMMLSLVGDSHLRLLRKGGHDILRLNAAPFNRRKVNAFIVLYRSALTGSLYAKTLRLRYKAARELGQVRIHFRFRVAAAGRTHVRFRALQRRTCR